VTELLCQVSTPPDARRPFVAGLILVDDICTEAAPILRRTCKGKSRDWLRGYFARMGWTVRILD